MDLQILDYSIYGNPCDRDSDLRLFRAAQRKGLSVCITPLTHDVPIVYPAPRVWLRYDLRSSDELKKIVDIASSLERMGKYVFPTSQTLQLSEDKWDTYQALCQAGVPTVKTYPISNIHKCGSRAVVKPRVGWGGMRMRVVNDTKLFERKGNGADEHFLCQPYIAHKHTWTVACAAGVVLACIKKSPSSDDFRTNELYGGIARLVSPPERTVAQALAALKAVNLTAGTVDLLIGADGFEVLEINAAPGLYYPDIPNLDLASPMVQAVLKWMDQS